MKGITKKCAVLKEENVIGRAAIKGATIIIDDPVQLSFSSNVSSFFICFYLLLCGVLLQR